MTTEILSKAVAFAFRMAETDSRIDFGLFGGEPLLEPSLVQEATSVIEHKAKSKRSKQDVRLSLVTNGTLLNKEILNYIRDHNIILQVSCDGLPIVQDKHRRFPNGNGSSNVLESNLSIAINRLPAVLVNMVYSPDTYSYLPESISYLSSLGLRQLILNPDYSAEWSVENIRGLKQTYLKIADLYLDFYQKDSPLFINLIDEKIAVILRGGYKQSERCHMGYSELAFSPKGYIYPCERLVGDGEYNKHCIGHLDRLEYIDRRNCNPSGNASKIPECNSCGVADFCMNWCGCSNYFSSGDYGQPTHFICASERFAIAAAHQVLRRIGGGNDFGFIHHYAGLPMVNSSK